MTDWEKFKVTELKEELRSRGIPLTGLKVKQQLIDKLNELDSGSGYLEKDVAEQSDEDSADAPEIEAQPEQGPTQDVSRLPSGPENAQQDESVNDTVYNETQNKTHISNDQSQIPEGIQMEDEQVENSNKSQSPTDGLTGDDRLQRLPEDLPLELEKEESHARDGTTPPPVEVESSNNTIVHKDDMFVPPQNLGSAQVDAMNVDSPKRMKTPDQHHELIEEKVASDSVEKASHNGDNESINEATTSTRVPTPELLDDQRKRKRRSLTPAPQDDVHKKSKLNDGTSASARRESDALQKVQAVTDAAQAVRDMSDVHNEVRMQNVEQTDSQMKKYDSRERSRSPIASDSNSRLRNKTLQKAPSPTSPLSADRDVTPATHPATQSVYIRNFKRPLQIPTLRNHISKLVGSSDENPLKVFYLDSIRTHAFVSFKSISAASRVRNAMHGTRFPDEPMREPLWIDFIPDEKVQTWIDRETDGGGGGVGGSFGGSRGSAKKFEVIYDDGPRGINATHQEVSGNGMFAQRSSFSQPQPNRTLPQNLAPTPAAASGVHPSRVSLVPQSPSAARQQPQTSQAKRPPVVSDHGKGFRALDELFSSTSAKPKLYYKLPPQTIIDDRLDMMQDLRVGHDQMGKSGDEGMKRYTFEKDERNGRDSWVDKGPEFGFGRRGQERLTGYGNTYGGARGRGGFRGSRRGGDSWRGR